MVSFCGPSRRRDYKLVPAMPYNERSRNDSLRRLNRRPARNTRSRRALLFLTVVNWFTLHCLRGRIDTGTSYLRPIWPPARSNTILLKFKSKRQNFFLSSRCEFVCQDKAAAGPDPSCLQATGEHRGAVTLTPPCYTKAPSPRLVHARL